MFKKINSHLNLNYYFVWFKINVNILKNKFQELGYHSTILSICKSLHHIVMILWYAECYDIKYWILIFFFPRCFWWGCNITISLTNKSASPHDFLLARMAGRIKIEIHSPGSSRERYLFCWSDVLSQYALPQTCKLLANLYLKYAYIHMWFNIAEAHQPLMRYQIETI